MDSSGSTSFLSFPGFLSVPSFSPSFKSSAFSYRRFYVRRIKRILPALIPVLTACLGLGWFVLYAGEYRQLASQVIGGATFSSNFVLWMESGYFDKASDTKPLLHLWSLGIEEQFYLFWPILVAMSIRKVDRFKLVLVILVLSSFAINIALVNYYPTADFYSPFSRFWELMVGGLLAHCGSNGNSSLK